METKNNNPAQDFGAIDFGDGRLTRRLQAAVNDFTKNAQKSILGTGNRSSAKAFYRLLGNAKFNLENLAAAARDSTISRMGSHVLLIEDTTDINLNGHKKTEGLGFCSEHIRGVKLHSCIAVTPEGLPLGLVGQYYETRPTAKNPLSKREKSARPVEEKESFRWLKMLDESTVFIPEDVHVITICDREGDFYELYAKAKELGEHFIIRATHNRITETDEKVLDRIRNEKAVGHTIINVPRNTKGKTRSNTPARQAKMEIAYCKVCIQKPKNVCDENLPEFLEMNIVRMTEIDSKVSEPIEWILASNLPIHGDRYAMTIVEHYIQRWKIERFHYVLKSGCGAEKIQQRTYERIKPMLFIYSVIAMHIMAVTYIGRVLPNTPCDVFLEEDEWKMLYRIIHKTKVPPRRPYSMAEAVKYLGELGSYKRAPSDGPPGLKSIWAGLFKLFEFMELVVGQV